MRAVIAVVVVVFVLVLLGWLRFSTPDGNPTLQVDTGEIREDTGEMVESGSAAIESVHEEVNEESDVEVRRNPSDAEADQPAEPIEQ